MNSEAMADYDCNLRRSVAAVDERLGSWDEYEAGEPGHHHLDSEGTLRLRATPANRRTCARRT